MNDVRILVVDDTEALREEIELMLQLAGYEVWGAGNGVEALELLKDRTPDLILCDVMMPDMDGHEFARRVRARTEFALVPFIFVSALSSRDNIRQGMEVGADDYVPKPFTSQELLRAVQSRLSRAAALQAKVVEEVDVQTGELLDQLTRAQKQEIVGQLAGGIVHDFNNLITVISTYANLAQSSEGQSEQLHEDLEEIRRASRKAAGLSRRILDLIRPQERKIVPLDISASLDELLHMVGRIFPKGVSIRKETSGSTYEVLADPRDVEQIFLNLLINSRDAMSEGGEIHIHVGDCPPSDTETDRPFLRVTVADTGPGVPEETAHQIFQPYFSTKSASGGTGLGLTTVKRLASALGGKVSLDTEVETGATFHVDLPKYEDAAEESILMDLPTT